jgi:hypothetical protein
MNRDALEKWASTIDRFRIIPRLLILLFMFLTYKVVFWFMSLETPTLEQAGLVSVCTGALTGAMAVFLGSGKKE